MRVAIGLLGVLILFASIAAAMRSDRRAWRRTYALLAGAGGIIAVASLVYADSAVVAGVDAFAAVIVVLMITSFYWLVARVRRSHV